MKSNQINVFIKKKWNLINRNMFSNNAIMLFVNASFSCSRVMLFFTYFTYFILLTNIHSHTHRHTSMPDKPRRVWPRPKLGCSPLRQRRSWNWKAFYDDGVGNIGMRQISGLTAQSSSYQSNWHYTSGCAAWITKSGLAKDRAAWQNLR